MKAGWRTVAFYEAVEDASAGNVKTPHGEYLIDGALPIVDQGERLIGGYSNEPDSACRSTLPVIIFGDHTRRLKYVDFSFGVGADGVKVLRPREGVDAKYLYHYLRSISIPAAGYDRHFKYLRRVLVTFPPLPEQRRIAEVLDRAETLRAQRRQALAQLDALAEAIFLDMFGDPKHNPKALTKQSIGSLVRFKSGDFLPASEMAGTGEFPVYGGNGVNGTHDRFLFDERRIVVGRVGAYCGCVHVSPANSWVTDNALYVSEMSNSVEFDYLVEALRLAKLNDYASQSGQPLVSASRLYPVEVLVPPLDRQRAFVRRLACVSALGIPVRASSELLNALFASLQHRAFRGEL